MAHRSTRHSHLARARALLLLTLIAFGCAGGADSRSDEQASWTAQALSQRLSLLGHDLEVGARGDDVRAVHAYFTHYGYFPNPQLQQAFPAWRPLVAQAPAQDDVFDAQSALAVRALQRNAALHESGVVDAATRALLAAPRCGTPDGIAALEADDKFAIFNSWTTRSLTWRLENSDDGISMTNARAAMRNALASWAATTDLTFTELTSGTANIEISFVNVDGVGGLAAKTTAPPNVTVHIDPSELWSVAATTPSNALDLQSVALHELGHALGLDHSSILGPTVNDDATMYPFVRTNAGLGKQDRTLAADDMIAVSLLYDSGAVAPGAGNDIAVGANGSVWSIGNVAAYGGYSIQKWNGTGWDTADGIANHIAVGSTGVPWVVNPTGNIYRRVSGQATSGSWEQITGCAHDIAAGADGSIWILGCQSGYGGYVVQKRNASGGWDQSPDAIAIAIAIGPTGIPWVVGPTGGIYRHSTNNPLNGSWSQLPGSATDLAVDPDGYVWKLGTSSVAGGHDIAVWNEQAALTGTNGAPAEAQWIPQLGGATSVAAGHQSVWFTDSGKNILRSLK